VGSDLRGAKYVSQIVGVHKRLQSRQMNTFASGELEEDKICFEGYLGRLVNG
jgi:hypothetical protein